MELDELKSAWAQYDKKLSRSLELNEALLRKMNLKDSKNEIQKAVMYELSNVVLMALWVLVVGYFAFRLLDEPEFGVPGLFSACIACAYFMFALLKFRKFSSIEHYGTPILQLQQDVASANRLMLHYRKYELLLFPFILVPSIPILFKVIHQVNIYENPRTFWTALILILTFSIPATILANKYLYDKKFQTSQRLLKEIEAYQSEA